MRRRLLLLSITGIILVLVLAAQQHPASKLPMLERALKATDKSPPAAILIAKQIVELKGAKELYQPMVRGVVQRVKNQFMQTNFMYAKDLNEIAANLERDYTPRLNELVDASARKPCKIRAPRRPYIWK